ncbi:4'-phosphopantetheinyl transferase family protein [Phaeodactylibacter luteus]|uniref:4'-phosphopantetheinyl transferase superfamily protein n=1 Tax=Phaeodactylibacter luteus TaxID=1564516 RepID=A0A5C6RIZ1_9BACT|nr:4'-phosphopantetheinyl transferase family protein [Phaeodactylibacter luteus]TXB61650.1 4'-phosphopantetheinyl transferase superfamily protein [Phaeodactylibacter luteus]
MPILKRYDHSPFPMDVAVWSIAEEENWFLERLQLSETEAGHFVRLRGRHRLEWLASRWLVHELSGRAERAPIVKDEFGKPFLPGSSQQVSISHSHGLAAVAVGQCDFGLDIQQIVGKIKNLAPRFLSTAEAAQAAQAGAAHYLRALHIYWCIKEALYKAYGRRALDLRADLSVEPFDTTQTEGRAIGWIKKGAMVQAYQAYFEQVGTGHLLACVWRDT